MEPSQLEFLGENQMIGIIPNFTLDNPVHLICGSIGPFRAGLPVHGNWKQLVLRFTTNFELNFPLLQSSAMVGHPFAQTTEMSTRATDLDGQRTIGRDQGVGETFAVNMIVSTTTSSN